jgi:thymidylate synthase (FAD)
MKCDCGGEAPMVWSATGVGSAHCKECGHLVAAINCPYIPPVEFCQETRRESLMETYVQEVIPVVDKRTIEVLNGGYIRLVDHMGGDLSVVRSARVSYAAEWRTGEDAGADEKLIRYLWTNRHTTPFEAVTFTFEVKAPIFVFRQWHRHRMASYNEVSARYTELDMGYYIPQQEDITLQSTDNKQMRTAERHPEAEWIQQQMNTSIKASYRTYQRLLDKGTPRELARIVLPVAMYSRMFVTLNLHSLFHFLTLRLHKHAQLEVRVYAEAMLKLIEPIIPVTAKVFNESRGEK